MKLFTKLKAIPKHKKTQPKCSLVPKLHEGRKHFSTVHCGHVLIRV